MIDKDRATHFSHFISVEVEKIVEKISGSNFGKNEGNF